MIDELYPHVSGALARAMAAERVQRAALSEIKRMYLERTLACSQCHRRNYAGHTVIELGDDGLAECECGWFWCPQLIALGHGYKP